MWVRQCHKPPMTGNVLCMFVLPIETYDYDWGMVYQLFYPQGNNM